MGLSRLRKNHFGTIKLRWPTRLRQEKNTFAGCSKRPSSEAAASEEARRTLRYVEPLGEARTKLADFFSILLVLYEQQAGGANLFPGGRTEEGLKLLYVSWKCGFHFPEQGVGTRWVVLGCGLSNQIVKPLSLLVGERDGVIAGAPWQNESRSPSDRFTDWMPTEPDEPPFCPWVIFNSSALEETMYPRGGDAWFWHGMVEPLADVECEPAPFEVIEHRPS
jgi:hypothetical protein